MVISFEHGVNQPREPSRQVSFDPACQGRDAVEDVLSAPPLLGEHRKILPSPLNINVDLVVGVEENGLRLSPLPVGELGGRDVRRAVESGVQIGRRESLLRDSGQKRPRYVLLRCIQECQSSAIVVGRRTQCGEQQLSGVEIQVVMALITPSVSDEGHAASDLLVLLQLVDGKQLGANTIEEDRHSGLLSSLPRPPSGQDLGGRLREDLFDDAAELNLGSMAAESITSTECARQ